jgi:hypothetical protein
VVRSVEGDQRHPFVRAIDENVAFFRALRHGAPLRR